MTVDRPTPREVVDELAARMTLPPPTGDPTAFMTTTPLAVIHAITTTYLTERKAH